MTRRPRGTPDPLEGLIETVLEPGQYISYGANFEFTRDLHEVEEQIHRLIPKQPSRCVALYETFLAGCYEKADEVDDSGGNLGQFVDILFRGWIQARQAAGSDPDETVTRLLDWMDHDPYGFAHELHREAAKVLDRAGLAAFATRIKARFDAASDEEASTEKPAGHNPEYERWRWSAALREIYLAKKDLKSYIAVTEETGLTPKDCHAIASILVTRSKRQEALAWVERGFEIAKETSHGSSGEYDLTRLRRDLLVKLGRRAEALDDAWSDFCKYPSCFSYKDLMEFVPRAGRSKWHAKAIEAAEKHGDLNNLLELLLETRETGRLVELIGRTKDSDLEAVSHYRTELAAKKLERTHSDLAARLWRAQGMRIVNAGKSKYYDAAISNLGCARRCYERAGLEAEWEKTVIVVRSKHHCKYGFMSRFEALIAGARPRKEQSFLERAKSRWGSHRQERKP